MPPPRPKAFYVRWLTVAAFVQNPMPNIFKPDRPDDAWLNLFPALQALEPETRSRLLAECMIGELEAGERGYIEGMTCRGYVLRLEGVTRIVKTSTTGREVVLYRVGPGETCVLTTSCLLGHAPYPAEAVAESAVREFIVPAPVFHELMDQSASFRTFVLANYGNLIGDLIMLIDEMMFGRVDIRLAQYLLEASDGQAELELTHQTLADELGSAREVVSRRLKEFERRGWVSLGRGRIVVANRAGLASMC